MAPVGRRVGTPNAPLSLRRSAVDAYRSRPKGVTREAIAIRYMVTESVLKKWLREENKHDTSSQQFGENTVYCGLDRLHEGPTKIWLQQQANDGARRPTAAEVVTQFRRLEPEFSSSRNYQALSKAATRLLQAVSRSEIKYTSVSRSVGADRIPRRDLPRHCKCTVSCEGLCPTRLDMTECTEASCRLGDRCKNRDIQTGSLVKCQRIRVEGRGYGLVAEEAIPKDTFVSEYVGLIVDAAQRERLFERGRTVYLMQLTEEHYVDATHYGNESRLMNHSHSPNCRAECWWVNGEPRVGIFTRQGIKAGVELTFNYGTDYYIETCTCKKCEQKRARPTALE